MKKSLLSTTLLACLLSPLVSQAADPFDQLKTSGAKVVHNFNSVAPGYRGVLADMNGAKRVFYATPDNKYLVYGVLYDASGKNLTTEDLLRLSQLGKIDAPATPAGSQAPAPAEKPVAFNTDIVWQAASRASGFTEGSGKDIYVYFDTNCPYCHQLWRKTRLYTGANKVHWLPVAGLRASSLNQGATVIKDPSLKNMELMANGQLMGEKQVSKDMADKMEFNMGAMAMTGNQSFPTILYTENGQRKVTVGLPPDEMIGKIFGK